MKTSLCFQIREVHFMGCQAFTREGTVVCREGILNLLDNLGTGAVRADFWNHFPVL